MDQKAKYNAAFRIGQEIANKLKILKQKDFETNLSNLVKMNEYLVNKTDFKVVPIKSSEDNDLSNDNNNTLTETLDKSDDNLKENSSDNNEEIISSQSSTISSDSYKVSDKNISMGTSAGRKKSKKRKLDHANGELSSYSSNATNFTGNSLLKTANVEEKSLDLPKSLKNIFEKRSYEILNNLLINKSSILDYISKKNTIEETNLIIDASLLTLKSFFLFHQYLKNSTFKLFFSEDAFILLECTIQNFMKSQKCLICSALFEIKETIKVCSECFNICHHVCSQEKILSSKKWICKKC